MTIEQIRHAADGGDWNLPVVERVLRMAQLLDACGSHPQLRDVLALKGGTALNLLDHDLPRLSVDLDFNVVGAADREAAVEQRMVVSAALQTVAERLSLAAREVKSVHAASAWRMTYPGVTGSGVVEIDLNFQHRVPLLPLRRVSARALDAIDVRDALTMAPPELAAGKLLALFDRTHARDVWDTELLASAGWLQHPDLRRCFVVYLAGARRPWRELLGTDIRLDDDDAQRLLVPMLRSGEQPRVLATWCRNLEDVVERAIAPLRTPTDSEIAFLDAVGDRGDVDPTLLGLEPADPIHDAILRSPVLAWKASNVRVRTSGTSES